MFGILAGLGFVGYKFFLGTKFGKKIAGGRSSSKAAPEQQAENKEVDVNVLPAHVRKFAAKTTKKD